MYRTLSNTYRAFIDRCSIVASICILKHALEICSLESCAMLSCAMSSSQSESRTMFFHVREK